MAKYAEHEAVERDAVFVYSPEQLDYKFSETHPFNQKRLQLTMDLLNKIGALDENDIATPRIATDDEV